MRAGYRAIGEEMLSGLAGTIVWAIFSSCVVVYLDRSYGRRWSNLVRYGELTWPALFAAASLLVAVSFAVDSEERQFMWVFGGYCAVLAVAAWVGVVRRWRWWVRWGIYVLCTAAVFTIGVVAAIGSQVE
jgi:hypothetical protein